MRIQNIPWTHTLLTVYTSGQTLNAVHTAVTSGKDYWLTFLHYLIPVGMTARILMNPVMQFKIYASGGEELHRDDNLMLAMQKVGKHTPTEIHQFDYSSWYDISWADQLNRDSRDALTLGMTWTEVLLWEGEQILFQIKNSSISLPASPHANTLIQLPIDIVDNADLARAFKAHEDEARKQAMKAKGQIPAD